MVRGVAKVCLACFLGGFAEGFVRAAAIDLTGWGWLGLGRWVP
jgi:hypothetical protein